MSQADDQLQDFLGAAPPAAFAALDDGARAAFTDLVLDARRRQGAALEEAFGAALKHVPFPARGIVRKVLLG
jgi:hypothetical protein